MKSALLYVLVVLPGFEPGNAAPKTVVLPLHYRTILCELDSSPQLRCKVNTVFLNVQIFLRKSAIWGGCTGVNGLWLLGDEQVVVLLASLCQDVLVVEQERGVDGHVLVGHLFLVDAHAAALGHLAHLALAGEHGCIVGEQADEGHAGGDYVAGHLESGHALEYREERFFVDAVQDVLRLVREENLRSLDGHLVVLLAVHHDGDLLGQALLQGSQTGVLCLLCLEVGNGCLVEVGEYLDVLARW